MQSAQESRNSIQSTEINDQLTILFVQCGISPDKAMQKAPFYSSRLLQESRTDLIVRAIMDLGDSWTSDKYNCPTVGDILAKYKILKYREANQYRPRNDLKATEVSQLFHSEFEKCKEDGITDINEMSEIIMKKIGGDKVKKSKCKLNFCDGKGNLIAIKKDDPYSSEYLLYCKCVDKIDGSISVWDNNNEYKIIKGQSDLASNRK